MVDVVDTAAAAAEVTMMEVEGEDTVVSIRIALGRSSSALGPFLT